MKFITLLKKELRQCLPWTIFASTVTIIAGLIILYLSSQMWFYNTHWYSLSRYRYLDWSLFLQKNYLLELSNFVMAVCIILAFVLAIIQFWIPGITGTWSFTIHHPVKKTSILWSKCIIAVSCILISQGTIWVILFLYSKSGIFPLPPRTRVLAEGFAIIITCIYVYWAAALAGINPAKWYTTKIFPLLQAVLFIVILAAFTSFLYWSVAYIVLSMVMLIQLRSTFLTREF